jgi:hypothetical protein
MTLVVGAINRAYLIAATPSARALRSALEDPRSAQMKILQQIVTSNLDCAFGRTHGFASIRSYSDFAELVPVSDYEDVRNDIEHIRNGGDRTLTHDPVVFLEPTGGSSGASKLIPYTTSLKSQIAHATNPWIRDILGHRSAIRNGRSYWAVSPPSRTPENRSSTVPIGASHDLDYLPRPVASLIGRGLVLPRVVSELDDLDATRYVTLRSLLAAEDLAFISVWNPSFLTLLMNELDAWFGMLLYDLERGGISIAIEAPLRERLERDLPARPDAAARLRRRFGSRPPTDLGELWTRLRMISCWTDGHAGRAVAAMRRRFPSVEVQGKGLLATEGVVSIPLIKYPAPVAAVTSHFLEFVPEMGGVPLLVDELEDGRTYEVVITTAGGLYRYRLKDVVRVEGHVRRTPMLRFVGRADAASDLCGEKLTPAFVERALSSAVEDTGVRPAFAVLSPRWGEPPWYELCVELSALNGSTKEQIARLGAATEAELRSAHHYNLCRRLGQLGPLRVRLVRDAERAYERARTARGQRAGVVKPSALIADADWSDLFEEVVTDAGNDDTHEHESHSPA